MTLHQHIPLPHYPTASLQQKVQTLWEELKNNTAHPLAPILASLTQPPLEEWRQAIGTFSFKNYIVLGTGGSSLGGQTLVSLAATKALRFIENIDPDTIDRYLKEIDFQTTGFIVISKSGHTAETLAQFIAFYHKAQQVLGGRVSQHFLIITMPSASPLKELSTTLGVACINHPLEVGGRFSAFTAVGMVPALLAGLKPDDFFKGAHSVLSHPYEALMGAAFAYQHYQNYSLSVMMVYSDKLLLWAAWFRQLWAESLGKEGKGPTPLTALGTVDQHSQLQLFTEGPADKCYTFIGTPTHGQGPELTFQAESIPALSYFQGKTMGDLFAAEQQATYHSLLNCARPARLLTLEHLDSYHMGALMTHFILETVLMAALMNIDAFSQPGVEESKRLTKTYLTAS